jgi:hypothetical protein
MMTKVRQVFLILSILLLPITACGKQSTATIPNTLPPIQKAEPGKATITGKIFSTTSNQFLVKAVWLAEVHRQGDQAIYVLNAVSSPGIYSDENGTFIFNNVDPHEYVIIIGDPEGQNQVVNDETGKPKVWNFTAGQIFDIGELKVTLTK